MRSVLPIFVVWLLTYAGPVTSRLSAEAPLVVTTHPVLLDVTRQLTADDFRLHGLIPANASPRNYDPTPDGVRQLGQARLVIVHGVDLEPWIEGMAREAGYNGEVIVASDRMPLLDVSGQLHDPEDELNFDFTQFDPFTWHDPRNVIHYARVIAVALTDLLPAKAAEIDERLRAYIRELESLHAYASERFRTLPPDRRRLATSHDTLRYLAFTYDLQIVPTPGFEPGRAPQPAQLARMIEIVESLHVPAVFLAAGSNVQALREIEQATGVRTVTTLFTETPEPTTSPPGDYVAGFRRNVDEIVKALH